MAATQKRLPGQTKLIRYRHTESCIRISGRIPEEEARRIRTRRMVLLAALLILWAFGFASI